MFEGINPNMVVNVVADAEEIHRRLTSRDGDCISLELIDKLQKQESHNAHEFCSKHSTAILDYKSGEEVSQLIRQLNLL